MSTRKPTVFIGSSTEDLPVLEAFERMLAPVAKVIPWTNEDKFRETGDYFLDALIQTSGKSDFAILIFGPNDVVHSRGKKQAVPRDNVIFELGLFISKLGRQRTFVIAPKIWRTGLKILSDLQGLKIEQYDSGSRSADYDAILKPICRRIVRKLREPRPHPDLHRPRGVTEVRRPLEDLIARARARRRPAVIRNIALDMETTWPLVYEIIQTPSLEVKDITWRSLMIDPQSPAIRKHGSNTVSTSTARDQAKKMVAFFRQNEDEMARRKIRFECRAYADLPTMHGFLFNDEALFFTVCGIKKGKLAGSANPYIRFDRGGGAEGQGDDSPAHFIGAFEDWFEERWRHARRVWPQ